MNCTCGHAQDEHGSKNPKYPNAKECLIEGCEDCIHFEWDGEEG